MTSNFICRILNEQNDQLKINLPSTHPAWMEMLNLLCGAEPVKWIDNTSHNKLFICTPELKARISDICKACKNKGTDITLVEDYFNNQANNSRLAFLRESPLLNISDDLIKKAAFMAGEANFRADYDTISFGEKEEYTGPVDLKACVCRFCGRSFPETRFKKRNAHAIPEALGNRLVFCNDECQTCNSDLSPIDKELTEYLKFRRSENKIPNKKKKIIKVYGHNFFYDGSTGELKISRSAILEEKEDKYFVKLEGADPITHLGIYKALAKIAIDLMPREIVKEFGNTVDWIKGNFTPKVIPNVLYAYRNSYVGQPLAKLFVRHDEAVNPEHPRCMVALTLIDLTFLFIVPLGKNEPRHNVDIMKHYVRFMFQELKPTERELYLESIDMGDRIGKFAHVNEWIKKSECEIVEQNEFDNTQEKNPNNVDFPPFEPSLVNIHDTNIKIESFEKDTDLTKDLRIEDTIVRIIDYSILPDIKKAVCHCMWNIDIQTLDNRKTVLKAKCHVVASHKCISKVCSEQFGEISPFFVEYLLDALCKRIGEIASRSFCKYDFRKLAEFILETQGNILHP